MCEKEKMMDNSISTFHTMFSSVFFPRILMTQDQFADSVQIQAAQNLQSDLGSALSAATALLHILPSPMLKQCVH